MSAKKCFKCGTIKDTVCFAKNKSNKDGLQDCCRECRRQYHIEDRPRQLEKMKERASFKTPEKKRETNRVHHLTKIGKWGQQKQRIRVLLKKGTLSDLTYEQWETFWQKPCSYCKTAIENVGIDRVDNNIGYIFSNCVACCYRCNVAKGNLTIEEWNRWRLDISQNLSSPRIGIDKINETSILSSGSDNYVI